LNFFSSKSTGKLLENKGSCIADRIALCEFSANGHASFNQNYMANRVHGNRSSRAYTCLFKSANNQHSGNRAGERSLVKLMHGLLSGRTVAVRHNPPKVCMAAGNLKAAIHAHASQRPHHCLPGRLVMTASLHCLVMSA
jgi:hypothetical protein